MKQFLTILFSIFLLFSCQTKENATHKNEQIIRQFFAHFNNHDWEKMANMYAPIAEFKDPTLGQGIVKQTHEQTMKKYADLQKNFPDVKDDIKAIYPSGENHIIVEFVSTGTAPDNSKFELPICTIFAIENGLITQDFTYFDNFEN